MIHPLHRYECPARFLERFRPVKAHPGEKGLPAYLFDAYGLAFYRQLSNAAAVPAEAIWSVIHQAGGPILSHGFTPEATAFVVAQALPSADDATLNPLPLRLGYRAKVAVQALQTLKLDLIRSAALNASEAIALIDRRIEAYHHPRGRSLAAAAGRATNVSNETERSRP